MFEFPQKLIDEEEAVDTKVSTETQAENDKVDDPARRRLLLNALKLLVGFQVAPVLLSCSEEQEKKQNVKSKEYSEREQKEKVEKFVNFLKEKVTAYYDAASKQLLNVGLLKGYRNVLYADIGDYLLEEKVIPNWNKKFNEITANEVTEFMLKHGYVFMRADEMLPEGGLGEYALVSVFLALLHNSKINSVQKYWQELADILGESRMKTVSVMTVGTPILKSADDYLMNLRNLDGGGGEGGFYSIDHKTIVMISNEILIHEGSDNIYGMVANPHKYGTFPYQSVLNNLYYCYYQTIAGGRRISKNQFRTACLEFYNQQKEDHECGHAIWRYFDSRYDQLRLELYELYAKKANVDALEKLEIEGDACSISEASEVFAMLTELHHLKNPYLSFAFLFMPETSAKYDFAKKYILNQFLKELRVHKEKYESARAHRIESARHFYLLSPTDINALALVAIVPLINAMSDFVKLLELQIKQKKTKNALGSSDKIKRAFRWWRDGLGF